MMFMGMFAGFRCHKPMGASGLVAYISWQPIVMGCQEVSQFIQKFVLKHINDVEMGCVDESTTHWNWEYHGV